MITSSSPLESGFYNSSGADYVSEWKPEALPAHREGPSREEMLKGSPSVAIDVQAAVSAAESNQEKDRT
jgi:hypothetical protein